MKTDRKLFGVAGYCLKHDKTMLDGLRDLWRDMLIIGSHVQLPLEPLPERVR